MKAGRELDALIAKHVFGMTLRNITKTSCELWHGDKWYPCGPCLEYSTNITDAWEVVERLVSTPGPNGDHHSVRVDYSGDAVVVIDENEDWQVSAIAATVPLAICLAALKAKGVTGEQHG